VGNTHLSALLQERRKDLIDRWTAAVRRENATDPVSNAALVDHMPRFVDELIDALRPDALPLPAAGATAVEHGAQRLEQGFIIGEVVREYGILHRCIIEIAVEANLAIGGGEQKILAESINAGVASAISQYATDRDSELLRQMSEHLGFIAHEVRNPLSSARVAFGLLQRRELAGGGRVVDLLDRTLKRTADVIDNALNQAALNLGVSPRLETLRLREVLDDVMFDSSAEAQVRGIEVFVTMPEDLELDADARLLRSALANLLRNAVKFIAPTTTVAVRAGQGDGGRVYVEIEDSCGGLPPGRAEELFAPLVQRGRDQTGYGLGLAIARQAAAAHNGTITVRDLPGKGCIFRIELPGRARR